MYVHDESAAGAGLRIASATRGARFPAEPLKETIAAMTRVRGEDQARVAEAHPQLEIARDLLVAPEGETQLSAKALSRITQLEHQADAGLEAKVVSDVREKGPERLLLRRELRHAVAAKEFVESLEFDGAQDPSQRSAYEIFEHQMHGKEDDARNPEQRLDGLLGLGRSAKIGNRTQLTVLGLADALRMGAERSENDRESQDEPNKAQGTAP